ncbi:hypothetical protein RHMOL_Rhmol04G0242400 [Rhododendron molle]|uniref:Uncharacterized protein n=1 Tax=Rhododendron molle TaxID=49168 RepID=A0ACC0P3Q2_RHOML|nr:hypothetical protein RHMOL_Rhmol04G0242400 [Rhododendron molle]
MDEDGEYDYDIYDEDMYVDEDPYYVDEYNWDILYRRRIESSHPQTSIKATTETRCCKATEESRCYTRHYKHPQ